MTVKKTFGVVLLVFLAFYIMTSPDHAASMFHAGWHVVVHVAHGIGRFIDNITSS